MSSLISSFKDKIVVLLLILMAAIADRANADSISVSARVDKPKITIGDVITYTLAIQHDPDMEITPPTFDFKGFDFIESGQGQSSVKGQDEFWYRIRADETGTLTLGPFTVLFKSPDLKNPKNNIEGQTLTPKVVVEVQSVLYLQGEPKDIRDIKPIAPIPKDWSDHIFYFFIALILILLGILIWKLKRPRGFEPAPQRIMTPHEQALLELEALNGKQLLGQGKIQEHYFELSEIFRRYLGARYAFPSLDWTTEEIHIKLSELYELNEHLREQASSILKRTDKIKFAKAIVDGETSAEILKSTIQFIHATATAPSVASPQ